MIWEEHVKNRDEFPQGELARYEGQHVARSLDGTRILGGDEGPLKLIAALQREGYRSDDYVLSFVDFGEARGSTAEGSNGGLASFLLGLSIRGNPPGYP